MTHSDNRPDAKGEAKPFAERARADTTAAGGDGSALASGLRIWEEETARFLEELIRQDRRTLEQLCECRSPLDVLSVEQDWVRARSRAYFESGLRFAEAFAAVSRETDVLSPDRPGAAFDGRGGGDAPRA
jgi:hypothetical protein